MAGGGAGVARNLKADFVAALLRRDAGLVADQAALSFGGLLRQLRAEARLTQEELAEAAQLSPRSVSDLERSINRTARWQNCAAPWRSWPVARAR
jgi:DNA-binding XRE family transcriptional regulator